MEKEEIEDIITELNIQIKDLEKSKKNHIYLFEPKEPNKIFLLKNEKPNFFLIENGLLTFFRVLIVSVLAFFTVGYNIELTLKISVITLFIILCYPFFIKFSEKNKTFKKNEEFNIKQSIKFEEETKVYNQKIEKYFNDKVENESIIKHNSEIDKKIKNLKDEVQILFKKLTENMDLIDVITKESKFGLIDFDEMNKRTGYRDLYDENNGNNGNKIDVDKRKNAVLDFIFKQTKEKQKIIYDLLKEVQQIQSSNLTIEEKRNEIKKILWTNQTAKNKIFIGAFLGTIVGLTIFGTGGIGIVGLGSGIGVWGFLTGTFGGVLVSSLIQNFESKK